MPDLQSCSRTRTDLVLCGIGGASSGCIHSGCAVSGTAKKRTENQHGIYSKSVITIIGDSNLFRGNLVPAGSSFCDIGAFRVAAPVSGKQHFLSESIQPA